MKTVTLQLIKFYSQFCSQFFEAKIYTFFCTKVWNFYSESKKEVKMFIRANVRFSESSIELYVREVTDLLLIAVAPKAISIIC